MKTCSGPADRATTAGSRVMRTTTVIVRTLQSSKLDSDVVISANGAAAMAQEQRLELQCMQRQLDIICLQKCRTHSDQVKMGTGHEMLITGADLQGQSGAQTWISQQPRCEVESSQALSSRIVLAITRLRGNGEHIAAIAARAPSSPTPIETRRALWGQLETSAAAARLQRPKATLFIGIDANA